MVDVHIVRCEAGGRTQRLSQGQDKVVEPIGVNVGTARERRRSIHHGALDDTNRHLQIVGVAGETMMDGHRSGCERWDDDERWRFSTRNTISRWMPRVLVKGGRRLLLMLPWRLEDGCLMVA
jgi:hypothetical protein